MGYWRFACLKFVLARNAWRSKSKASNLSSSFEQRESSPKMIPKCSPLLDSGYTLSFASLAKVPMSLRVALRRESCTFWQITDSIWVALCNSLGRDNKQIASVAATTVYFARSFKSRRA